MYLRFQYSTKKITAHRLGTAWKRVNDDRKRSLDWLNTQCKKILTQHCVAAFHFCGVECHAPLEFSVYLSWTQHYLIVFSFFFFACFLKLQLSELSKPVGNAETWESMIKNNGVNPKTRADKKTKEQRAEGEGGEQCCVFNGHIPILMMDTQDMKLLCEHLLLYAVFLMSCQKPQIVFKT